MTRLGAGEGKRRAGHQMVMKLVRVLDRLDPCFRRERLQSVYVHFESLRIALATSGSAAARLEIILQMAIGHDFGRAQLHLALNSQDLLSVDHGRKSGVV